jgi:hypothetical protein
MEPRGQTRAPTGSVRTEAILSLRRERSSDSEGEGRDEDDILRDVVCVAWGSRGSIDEESIVVWVLTGRPASDSIFCSKDKRLLGILGLLQKKNK